MTRKNWLVLAIMLLIGGGIIAYSLRTVNIHLLVRDFFTLNWWWMFVALVCICLYLILEGVVVKIFMKNRYPAFTWKDAMRLPPI